MTSITDSDPLRDRKELIKSLTDRIGWKYTYDPAYPHPYSIELILLLSSLLDRFEAINEKFNLCEDTEEKEHHHLILAKIEKNLFHIEEIIREALKYSEHGSPAKSKDSI